MIHINMMNPYNQMQLNLSKAHIKDKDPSLKAQLTRKLGAYLMIHQAF